MPPIRELLMLGLGASVYIMFLILSVGNFSLANGVPVSNTLASNYTALSSNTYAGTPLQGISPLQKQLGSVKNASTNSTFLGGTVGALSITGSLFSDIFGVWNAYITWIGDMLQVVGINPGIALIVGSALIIILVVLSIVSALLIFPV